MAVLEKDAWEFTVTTADSIGQTWTRTCGFEPKAVILFTLGRADTTDAVGLRTWYSGWGWATSASERRGVGMSSQHNQPSSASARSTTETRCLTIPNVGAGTAAYLIDVDAILSDGYRLILDATNSPLINARVMVVAVGGSAVLAAEVGTTLERATAGNTVVTLAMSQTPTQILFGAVGLAGVGQQGIMMIGASDGTRHGNWLGYSQNAATTSNTKSLCDSAWAITMCSALGTVDARANVSVAAGQFTIAWNIVDGAGTRPYYYLALAIDSDMARTDKFSTAASAGNAIGDSGWAFTPGLLLAFGANRAESTPATFTDHNELTIGVAIAPGTQRATGASDQDNLPDTEITSAIRYADFYVTTDRAGGVSEAAKLNTFDAGGWSGEMVVAAGATNFAITVALGPGAAQPVGEYVRLARRARF